VWRGLVWRLGPQPGRWITLAIHQLADLVLDPARGLTHLPHETADRPRNLGDALRPKDDEGQDHQKDQLTETDAEKFAAHGTP
jgi:hypothetical protein